MLGIILDLKVVVLGQGGVGKTSLINRYIRNEFSETVSTIGASFALKRWNSFYIGIWVNFCVVTFRIQLGRKNTQRYRRTIAKEHRQQ